MITAIWHILSTGEYHSDLGGDYHTRRTPERALRRKIAAIEAAGYAVTKTEAAKLPLTQAAPHPRVIGLFSSHTGETVTSRPKLRG
jgi:hypothetical protein